MNYRPEIDGLRAIAIIPVLLFHAGSKTFQGGFIGVDVFFVISGYLITSIILSEISRNDFSLKSFYERRARRILPSLFVVMAASTAIAASTMAKDNLYAFFKSLTAASSFLANVHFYKNIGYFDTGSGEKPLLHLWSLSVEEQFYIIFPLLVLAIRSKSEKIKINIILFLCTVSLIASFYIGASAPALAFYSTPLRGWELLAGSHAAIITASQQQKNINKLKRNLLGICGLALILSSIVTFEENMKNLSAYTVAPVLGTYLIIVYGTFGTSACQLLSLSFFTRVGLASYSIYLWHQPLYAYLRITRLETPEWGEFFAAFTISIVLGYVSWRWIEAPFRDKQNFSSRNIFLFSGIGITAFIIAGIAGAKSTKNAEDEKFIRLGERQAIIPRKFSGLTDASGANCSTKKDPSRPCIFQGKKDSFKNVAIVGDSHARVLSEELEKALRGTDYNLIDLTASGCPLLPELQIYSNHEPTYCTPEYQRLRLEYLLHQRDLTVVMTSRLPLYINGKGFDNSIGGIEDRPPYYASKAPHASVSQRKMEISISSHTAVMKLIEAGAKVVIVKPVPTNGWNPIDRLIRLTKKMNTNVDRIEKYMSIPLQAVQEESIDADFMIDDIVKQFHQSRAVETKDIFCDYTISRCTPLKGDKIWYADIDHLSSEGNRLVAERVLQHLQ